jgi:hypothetical protein
MFRKWLEKLRGSSREPDDMALGTKRPGDFVEPDDGQQPVVPNPHDQEEKDGNP